ncbi:hypothetical protein AB4Z54_71150, partial [Streptomyces sp. MCAF7]
MDDPLEDVPLGQHTANASRRQWYADTVIGGLSETDGYLLDPAAGGSGERVIFIPELSDQELDQLAPLAEIKPGTAPGRWVVRRLTRALRLVFGPQIEADRSVPGGRYHRLLTRAGGLELLRHNDSVLD